MWIHKNKNWPCFNWDDQSLLVKLAAIRHEQGILLGGMQRLGFSLRSEADLINLTSDVVESSAIEGENLDREEVRLSIARHLGLEAAGLVASSRNIEGIVEVMLDATKDPNSPLTSERIFGWHSALFPTGRSGRHKISVGCWRTPEAGPIQVVSGELGNEKIHFEAPDAELVPGEMQKFFHWFNSESEMDPVIKAGIAHLWFITIHPFDDGNGRLARAISDMALARADRTTQRFYSLSSQIKIERKDYYNHLEIQQRSSLDITLWLNWFLQCLGHAIDNAGVILDKVCYKADLWSVVSHFPVNDRQRLILNRLLDDFQGFLQTGKYAKLAKCSSDTALRDITALVEWGILIRNDGGGRTVSYRLKEAFEL